MIKFPIARTSPTNLYVNVIKVNVYCVFITIFSLFAKFHFFLFSLTDLHDLHWRSIFGNSKTKFRIQFSYIQRIVVPANGNVQMVIVYICLPTVMAVTIVAIIRMNVTAVSILCSYFISMDFQHFCFYVFANTILYTFVIASINTSSRIHPSHPYASQPQTHINQHICACLKQNTISIST